MSSRTAVFSSSLSVSPSGVWGTIMRDLLNGSTGEKQDKLALMFHIMVYNILRHPHSVGKRGLKAWAFSSQRHNQLLICLECAIQLEMISNRDDITLSSNCRFELSLKVAHTLTHWLAGKLFPVGFAFKINAAVNNNKTKCMQSTLGWSVRWFVCANKFFIAIISELIIHIANANGRKKSRIMFAFVFVSVILHRTKWKLIM